MIALIDYGVGNLTNLCNAIDQFTQDYEITREPANLHRASKIILPGVGAFGFAMDNLKKRGFEKPLLEEARKKKILGICVGMQLLFTESSEHGSHKGLNLIPGKVTRFGSDLKIPQIGWNSLRIKRDDPILEGVGDGDFFYSVHSYACHPEKPEAALGVCDYGEEYACVVKEKNVYGFQFHPEKSSDKGIRLLRNFFELPA